MDKSPRPFTVTMLIVLVLSITSINLLRFIGSLRHWVILADLLPYLPYFLAISGLFWGVGGLYIGFGLSKGKPWAPMALRISSLIYAAYFWIERLALTNPDTRGSNGLLLFVINMLIIIWIFWSLSSPRLKEYYGVLNE